MPWSNIIKLLHFTFIVLLYLAVGLILSYRNIKNEECFAHCIILQIGTFSFGYFAYGWHIDGIRYFLCKFGFVTSDCITTLILKYMPKHFRSYRIRINKTYGIIFDTWNKNKTKSSQTMIIVLIKVCLIMNDIFPDSWMIQ